MNDASALESGTPLIRRFRRTAREWAEMVKFAHTLFALPFALVAAFLAARHLEGGYPDLGRLGLILLCMVGARSAAMTFNRIADAAIDARNERTRGRAIPAGRLSTATAWGWFASASALFLVGCAGFLVFYGNPWPIGLALPVLGMLCSYSYAKRFTSLSHLWLGTAIGLSPLAAWLAIHPASVGWPAVCLVAAVACWIGGFDIIYACQDIEVDRREGLFSLPSRVGPAIALGMTRGLHAVAVALLIAVSLLTGRGMVYGIGVAAATILLVVENSLVKVGDYRHVGLAFFTLNGIVSCVFAILAIVDVLVTPNAITP